MNDLEFANQLKKLRFSKVEMREFLKIPGHLDRLFDLAIKAGGKKPPKHKSRSSLPADFPGKAQIDRATGFWAQRKRRDLVADLENQVQGFRDHHNGRGTLAADWPATWGTWMRNALKFNRDTGGPTLRVVDEDVAWRWRIEAFYHGKQEEDGDVPVGYWQSIWGPEPGKAGCLVPAEAIEAYRRRRPPAAAVGAA